MCIHLVPVYYGDRPEATRGNPNESKDYYFKCYTSVNFLEQDYEQAESIEDLCDGCKKYCYIRPLTSDEIREKFYNGKSREIMVVGKNGYHFKTV